MCYEEAAYCVVSKKNCHVYEWGDTMGNRLEGKRVVAARAVHTSFSTTKPF